MFDDLPTLVGKCSQQGILHMGITVLYYIQCSRLYRDEVVVQEPHSQITSNKNPSLDLFFFFPRI
jgi:hypothetical protein